MPFARRAFDLCDRIRRDCPDPEVDNRCNPQRGRELNSVTYQPHILIKNGSPTQVAIPIQDSRMAIGRDQAADIVIDDPAVSRKHAEIVRANDGFLLLDLGSMNGSFVNEMEVGRVGKILRDGDEIRLGSGHSALIFRESNFSQIASRKLRVTESMMLREAQPGVSWIEDFHQNIGEEEVLNGVIRLRVLAGDSGQDLNRWVARLQSKAHIHMLRAVSLSENEMDVLLETLDRVLLTRVMSEIGGVASVESVDGEITGGSGKEPRTFTVVLSG